MNQNIAQLNWTSIMWTIVEILESKVKFCVSPDTFIMYAEFKS